MASAAGDRAAALAALLVRSVAIAGVAWYLGAYLVLAQQRLLYPFELEWMEGGSVDHVARLLGNQGLYGPPRLEFVPFNYTPLYFYVSALVAKVTGLGFFPLRLVSFASSLLCLAGIHQIVKNETRSAIAALLAAGLFAATYRASGAWFDVARVDSLFLAFFLAALFIVRRSASRAGYVLAGVLLSLSFLTKQTALAMAVPLVAYLLWSRRQLGIWLAGSLVTIVAASTAAFHAASEGWYGFYVFELPFRHAWAKPVFVTFWTEDMLGHLPIAATLAALFVLWQLRSRGESLFWPAVSVGMIGGAYRSRLQTGGYDNVLFPAYAAVAIMFGLAVGALLAALLRRDTRQRRLGETLVYAGCIAQLAFLAYDPRAQLPRPGDATAGAAFLGVLSRFDGEVFVPGHGYLPTLAGKRPYAHAMPVFDVLKTNAPGSQALAEEHRQAILEARFDAIVLDENLGYAFEREVRTSYVLQSRLFVDEAAFFPVTGLRTRPQLVYVRRSDSDPDSAVRARPR